MRTDTDKLEYLAFLVFHPSSILSCFGERGQRNIPPAWHAQPLPTSPLDRKDLFFGFAALWYIFIKFVVGRRLLK
ncbi:MAG: hypothetical protein B6D34_06975 [Candidatus Brocadia sp. UTAMX1]|jgi:hypothetical protein|nr:MAG: hypothetical protein B6D34_06975 [Candidatus Brocadia sp. UTAMX1]